MNTTRNRQRGMALVVVLIVITVAIVIVGGLSMRLVNQDRHVLRYVAHKECFQGVEAAYVRARFEIEDAQDGNIGLGDWTPSGEGLLLPSFDDAGVAPLTLASSPHVEYFAYTVNWGTDGIDNNLDGIMDANDTWEFWRRMVYCYARDGESIRSTETLAELQDVNVWRNAIFAGGGMAGGVINGNVSIHGAVHILGDQIVEGGASLSAIDLSGTSLIHNNYEGCPADLLDRVPALPQRDWNGEMVGTLEATLRVQNGLVGMSGNSEIGSADVFGNSVKETMDGTFVDDGWTGNAVTDDGDRGDPQSVWSDNDWDELYDLGNRVSFPLLTDDWRAPITGDREWNGDLSDWYTHEDYFNEVLVADPAIKNDGIYVGDIDLYTQGDDFYWNATTGEELSGSLPATPPAADDDYILFNADTDVLLMNGQIAIQGDLTIRGKANQNTINYSGRAAFLVDGNAQLDSNLLSCNNGDPSDTTQSFPVDNIIGVMASQDMVVGSVAQISLMGAFYAQGKITSEKQTNIMGTFVSSYFDMGTNVPSIFQVPALADNLPMGMVGNFPVLSFYQVYWRELGVEL